MGHMFNGISDALELPLKDPIRPTKKRCSNCNKIGHSCPGATQIAIPSLVQSFKRVSDVVPDALTGLSDRPEQVNRDSIAHVNSVARATRAAAKTLPGWVKHIVSFDHLTLEPGMLQLILVGMSVATSEAVAETFGSVMEKYHNTRFFNVGPANDDTRLQREMMVRLNGPPLGVSEAFCSRISDRLNAGPTAAYTRLHPYQRKSKVGRVVKRLKGAQSGFFK